MKSDKEIQAFPYKDPDHQGYYQIQPKLSFRDKMFFYDGYGNLQMYDLNPRDWLSGILYPNGDHSIKKFNITGPKAFDIDASPMFI
jgi:hypothetical protein